MNKNARNKAKDPIQQALRDKKQDWNARARELISNFIAAKSAFNGRPIGKEKTKITDPIDSSAISALSQLASGFSGLASEANEIARAQYEYATAFHASHQKTASNALTRGLFFLKSPFVKNKHFRSFIVKNSNDLRSKTLDLQNFLVSSGTNYMEINTSWILLEAKHKAFATALSEYIKTHPASNASDPSAPPAPDPTSEKLPTELSDEAKDMFHDLGKAIVRLDDPAELQKFFQLKNKIDKGGFVSDKEIKEFFERISQEIASKKAHILPTLKVAHNFLTRTIKKNIKNLIPTDHLGYYKISLYNELNQYLSILNLLMNLAENDQNLSNIGELTTRMVEKFEYCKSIYTQISGFSRNPPKPKKPWTIL